MTRMKPQLLKLINDVSLNASLIIFTFQLHHTCEIFIFDRVIYRSSPPVSTFDPVKSFIHVRVHYSGCNYVWATMLDNVKMCFLGSTIEAY
jgi:hypothetical protein